MKKIEKNIEEKKRQTFVMLLAYLKKNNSPFNKNYKSAINCMKYCKN